MDREKVIKAVDSCFDYWLDQHRYLHPLELETVRQRKADALALLKEQEAVEPVKIPWLRSDGSVSEKYRCGSCDLSIFPSYKYCPFCGQAVKWE